MTVNFGDERRDLVVAKVVRKFAVLLEST
jgi:hypothetical protein